MLTRLNGQGVWCVFRLVVAFKFCKSALLRRFPSFWETVIILVLHVVAVSDSMMFSAASISACD